MSQAETLLETTIPAYTLHTTLDILQSVALEAKLNFGKDGINVAVVDPANVCMHRLEVKPAAFADVPKGQFTLGTNLERYQDCISKADTEQLIANSFRAEDRMLHVEYGKYSTSMAAIDPDSIRQEPDIPDLDLANEVVLDTSDFKDAIDMCQMVSDHVNFECRPDDEAFAFYAEGDTDETDVVFGPDDVVSANITKESVSKYSLDYLEDILKAVPSDEIRMIVDQEFPVKMYYGYADGNAEVETMIAPRISSE